MDLEIREQRIRLGRLSLELDPDPLVLLERRAHLGEIRRRDDLAVLEDPRQHAVSYLVRAPKWPCPRYRRRMFSTALAYERYMGRWSRQLAPDLVAFARPAGDDVLDIGAGTGVLARAILDHRPAARVVGIDRSADYVQYATEQVPS